MKKLLVLVFTLLLALSLTGQEVVYTDLGTVVWNTTHVSTPLVTYTYEVWIDDGATQTLLIEVAAPPVSIDVTKVMYVGVRTVENIAGTIRYSTMNWSQVNGAQTPNPFILVPLGLDAPGGFRYQ